MRVLITGAGGQVGQELSDFCTAAGDDIVALRHSELDVGDRDAVMQALTATRPDLVVHTAAWTAVDACESDPDRAYRVNALGTRHVAEASARVDAHLVHVSTDYVFDGEKPAPYDEWDVPNPRSVYGRSKWAGECELDRASDTTVVRIAWVCGLHGGNMVKTALRLASDGVDPKFVDDQIGSPTFVEDLVPALRRLGVERRPGLFHVTNQGAVSWYEFVRAVFECSGHDPSRVSPISTAELDPPRPAPRPANSVLDNVSLRLSGLPLLPPYEDALARLVKRLAE